MPPGWSSWHTILNSDTNHYAYGYLLNNNGVVEGPYGDSGSWETREYGEIDDAGCPYAPLNGKPCLYETDKFNALAVDELATTPPEQPFYMQVDYTSPHGDFRKPAGPQPATRHIGRFAGAPLPDNRAEGFNEGNVNDKPRFIREAPYLSATEIHTYRVYYQNCLAALLSVDEGVKEIVDELGALGRLRNTYIIFTSDNGFFFGQHRLVGGKFLAYEPATHLPLIIRGPGIKPNTQSGQLASTIDIAPTILELAEVAPDKSVDGVSLAPYAKDPTLRSRRPLLFESFVQTDDVEANGQAPTVTETSTPERTAPGAARGKLPERGGAHERRREPRRPRLGRGAAEKLLRDPSRPLQVHRVAGRRERALRHQQRPERAQQHRPGPQLRPDPQLPAQRTGTPRGMFRAHLPGSLRNTPADARPAAGSQTRKRKRTAGTRTRT